LYVMRCSHTRLTVLALVLPVVLLARGVTAQPRGGVVRGTIENGTTGGPGQAEKVTLIHLSSGMEPIRTEESVSGSFTLEGFEVSGETPYLLQVTSGGVHYNQPINFGRGYEANVAVTVFDVTSDWKDVTVSTARYLVRREHDRLRIDKLFVIDNKTEPKKTLYDPDGTFRFVIPPDVAELRSVSASSESGMPVPQSASPLPDGSGYVTRTAFKPGTTDFSVSYDVEYKPEGYRFEDQAFYPLPELLVLVAPADIELDADGWEALGPEPDGRFNVLRRTNVSAGTPLEIFLSGGSEHAEDLIPSSSSEGESAATGGQSQITVLPDPTSAQKWIVVTLMAAALAYGLLASLIAAPEATRTEGPKKDALKQAQLALERLEKRHDDGKISTKHYRKEKREIQNRLANAGRKKP
jgi:hypothetical protein